MGARGRRRRERTQRVPHLAAWDSLLRSCPECGQERREVYGPDDLDPEQRQAYAEVVGVMGQPAVMHICDRCERIGFMGTWE